MKRTQQRFLIAFCLFLCFLPFMLLWEAPDFFASWLRYLVRDTSYYDVHIQDISGRYGMDHLLVKALIKAESRFDHEAVSPRGAMGLMQLMPGTARDMGVKDPFDPRENIEGGVRYLKALMRQFNNDVALALAAYNAGPETVRRYGCVPPYRETRQYLRKVIEFYSIYKKSS